MYVCMCAFLHTILLPSSTIGKYILAKVSSLSSGERERIASAITWCLCLCVRSCLCIYVCLLIVSLKRRKYRLIERDREMRRGMCEVTCRVKCRNSSAISSVAPVSAALSGLICMYKDDFLQYVIHSCVCMYVCVHVCIYIYIYMCVCVCV